MTVNALSRRRWSARGLMMCLTLGTGGLAWCPASVVSAQDEGEVALPDPSVEVFGEDGRRALPEGWASLDAVGIAVLLEVYYQPPGALRDAQRPIVEHVWANYLNNEAFIAESDIEQLEVMVTHIGHRVRLHEGLATAEELSLFQDRIAARYEAELNAGGLEDFEVLRGVLGSLRRSGVASSELAGMAADWYAGQDPAGLTLREQVYMCDLLRDDLLDPRNMSGVYEGTLTLPQAGAYTFSRYLAEGVYANDWVVVQVGGQIVLDTRPNEDGEVTVSGPVELTSGGQAFTATFFRVDDPEADGDVGPVEHVLCWRTPGSREEDHPVLVPGSAFGQAGVTARYFQGAPEGDPITEQQVPGVDRIGQSFGQRHAALLNPLVGLVTSPQRVAGWAQEVENDPLLTPAELAWFYRITCRNLGASDRVALTDAVCGHHPAWVGTVNASGNMPAMMRELGGVPPQADGSGAMVTLVGTWAANRPRFQTRIGSYPGWALNGYLKVNDDPYAHMGYVLGWYESQWPVMQAIIEESMTEPGGTCDIDILKLYLETAKIADRSAGRDQSLGTVKAYIDDILADDAMSGDVRATWLVARGISDEAQTGDAIPLPMAGWRYFEGALVAAESVEVRFWVLNEMMARAISMGEEEIALSLLGSLEHQFPASEVAPGKISAEGNPLTYAEVFQGWRALASSYGEARRARAAREELDQRVLIARGEVEVLEADLEGLDAGDERRRGAVAAQLQEARSALEALEAEQAALDE